MEWSKKVNLIMGSIYVHKKDGTRWRVFFGDSIANIVQMDSISETRFIWIGSSQELLKFFKEESE